MAAQTFTIRTLEDFLQVPNDQLGQCLHTFRQHIERAKLAQADAKRLSSGPALVLDAFKWAPKSSSKAAWLSHQFQGNTPLSEMGLRPSVVYRLRELNIFCLEDCAEASLTELLRIPDIGQATVVTIREQLIGLGMDFKENPNPEAAAHDRARLFRKEPLTNRKSAISDESEIAALGFSAALFTRCMHLKIDTLGKLRSQHPYHLYVSFGRASLLEISKVMECLEVQFTSNPTQLELWRYGLRDKSQLVLPDDSAPVLELRPWIGAAAEAYHRHGIESIKELKALLRNGGGKVRGIGKSTLGQVFDFFGLSAETKQFLQLSIHSAKSSA